MAGFFRSALILSIIPIIGLIAGFYFFPRLAEPHASYAQWLFLGSAATLAIALGMLSTIAIVGRLARNNRPLLRTAFSVGLWAVKLLTVALVLANAAILITSIFYAEVVFTNRVHIKIIGGIALGAAYCVFAIAKAALVNIDDAFEIDAKAIDRKEGGEVWNIIDDIANRVGTKAPDNLIVGLEPNFFVTEQRMMTIDGELKGRTIYLSLAASDILTKDELKAIIGHELAHFSGDDITYANAFYPIYRRTEESIERLADSESVIALPIISILRYFLDAFSIAESELSRERELIADAIGAKYTFPEAIGIGLVKLHAACDSWDNAQKDAVDSLCEGKPATTSYTKSYRAYVDKELNPESIAASGSKATAHPFDSHPPLAERLAALKLTLDGVKDKALKLPTEGNKATELFTASDKLDAKLSELYTEELRRRIAAYQQMLREQQEEADQEDSAA